MRTHYDVLGVNHKASAEEIGSAYRFLASKFHPDVNLGRESEARRRFLEVQEAFEVLSDFQQRLRYDAGIVTEPQPREEPKSVAVATELESEPETIKVSWPTFDDDHRSMPNMGDDFFRPVYIKRKRRRGYSLAALFFMACLIGAAAIIVLGVMGQKH